MLGSQVFVLEPHGNEIAKFKMLQKKIASSFQEKFVFFPFVWAILPTIPEITTSKEFSKKIKTDFSLIKVENPVIDNNFLYCPLLFKDKTNTESYLYHQKYLSENLFSKLPKTCGIILGYNKNLTYQKLELQTEYMLQFKVGKIIETTILPGNNLQEIFIEKKTENWFKLS